MLAARSAARTVAARTLAAAAPTDVVIIGAARTPVASFNKSLKTVSAPALGTVAIKGALGKAGISPDVVGEVFMGNVISAGAGQAPARQAALEAGIPNSVPCTTVNKVCASGLKSVMIAAQTVQTGSAEVVVAGGMESMSRIPHLLNGARNGYPLGGTEVVDALLHDGLTDAYNNCHMGVCGEKTAADLEITRETQDEFALNSYRRSAAAWEAGKFDSEVVPVEVPGRRGKVTVFAKDEEYTNIKEDKIPTLRAVFKRDGTITAANASTLNDGASALVITSRAKAEALGAKPLARIIGFADAACDPKDFPIAPALAVPIACERAGISMDDIDYHEINEAFSVVPLAIGKKLNVSMDKVNVFGGGVSLGHPIGSSGSRILVTLLSVLKDKDAKIGCASICNGGGGASALVVERE